MNNPDIINYYYMTKNFFFLEEAAILIIDMLFLMMMNISHPKKTVNLKYDRFGIIAAIPANIAMITACIICDYFPSHFFSLLVIVLAIHAMLNAFLIMDLFLYLYYFPQKNIKNENNAFFRKLFLFIDLLLSILTEIRLSCLVLIPGITAEMLTAKYIQSIACIGIVAILLILAYEIIMRKYLIRVIRRVVAISLPIAIAVLLNQYFQPHLVILSLTYIVPFMLFYLFFHSNPYDELTGFQNPASMESRLEADITEKKPFYYGYLIIPELDNGTIKITDDIDTATITSICMQIENLSPKMHLFRINRGIYNSLLELPKSEEADAIYRRSAEIALAEFKKSNVGYHTQIIGFFVNSEMNSTHMIKAFANDILQRSNASDGNFHYLADEEDFRLFMKNYTIEEALRDIALKGDPNDERVLCYAQPIYDVETGSFRTAEALMRMSLNGSMVPPNIFIPIAEDCNLIHSLTLIMLNKVCEQIAGMSDSYEFDAITVNCSSKEFSRPNLYQEFMDIIDSHHIQHDKIRFELTESAIFDNPDEVKTNMETLSDKGIKFYLDDFGTGYSSVERIIAFPFHTIKFDKSLLDKSLEDHRMDNITTYMVDVLKKDGFDTLVEGVEDDRGVSYSMKKGFDYIQGFYYAKPVPIENLTSFFKKGK